MCKAHYSQNLFCCVRCCKAANFFSASCASFERSEFLLHRKSKGISYVIKKNHLLPNDSKLRTHASYSFPIKRYCITCILIIPHVPYIIFPPKKRGYENIIHFWQHDETVLYLKRTPIKEGGYIASKSSIFLNKIQS